MSISLRVPALVITIGVTSLIAPCWGQMDSNSDSPQRGQKTVTSVARYAIEDFVVGCRVRPQPLFADPYFGSLPIQRYFPEPVSLGRLHGLDVEELAVFCGPATGEKANAEWKHGLEWAAAARLAKPIELKALMRGWRRSLVPQEKSVEPNPEPIRLGGFDCFRIPAGSFFPPPRIYGKLRFTDRDGKPADKGVNTGNIYEYRSYVEGGTKASAIFTLAGIDEADLVDGQLPLGLRLDVFLTYYPNREFTMAQVELQNPDTGLRSEPVRIEAKSYVNRRLNFPRRLTAIDANGKRQADLLEDFVSGGRLEVVLKGTEEAIYLGVGEYDLNLRPRAFEYVFVNGRELVVAQTSRTLEAMLQNAAKPLALADRLTQAGEIVIAASVHQQKDRKALKQIVRLFEGGPIARRWANALTELTGTVRLDQTTSVEITVKFTDRPSAEKAGRLCRKRIRELREQVRKIIRDGIDRVDAMASLASLAWDGISFAFPDEKSLTQEQQITEHEKRKAELLKIIDEAFDETQVESAGNVLTIKFTRPRSLSNLSKPAKYAWAKMDESHARFLFNFEKFDLSDEVLKRVTDHFPNEPGAWLRRAWHLSYNVTPRFDGYETRYAWVRRGINVLLDGAEQNPGSIDMLWMAARFIGRKIGQSDDYAAFRELFSKDKELHRRLAKYIDLDKSQSPDKEIDNWLVAKLLFEYCIDRRTNDGASSTIPPLLVFSRPAATQASYADSLARNGRFNESRQAWKEAERLHEKLGDRSIEGGARGRIRMKDLEDKRDKLGPNDPYVKYVEGGRKFLRYDFWLMRCRFEQMDEIQSVRKLNYEAAKHKKQSEWKAAAKQYRRSLEILAELEKRHPEEMALLAGDFSEIATGYRKAQKRLGQADEESLEPILKLLDAPDIPFPRFH